MARLQAEQPGDLGPIRGADCGSQNCVMSSPFSCSVDTGTSGKVASMSYCTSHPSCANVKNDKKSCAYTCTDVG
jgi:hypothetical protein